MKYVKYQMKKAYEYRDLTPHFRIFYAFAQKRALYLCLRKLTEKLIIYHLQLTIKKMAVRFKLVKRKNLGADKETIPEKLYVQSKASDKIPFDYLLEEIADAGIPSSQVRAVIDRMNFLFRRHLAQGHIVQFGDFGNFRYSLGSTGAETEEEFTTDLIKVPRIIFNAGVTLQKARRMTEVQREETPVKEEEENEPGGGL